MKEKEYNNLENKTLSRKQLKINNYKKNQNNINYKAKKKKNDRLKIFITFLLVIYLLLYYLNFNDNKFSDILPKLSLNNTKISSLDQIFNSRILYIPYANITKDYIRYIRPIKEIKEQKKNNSQNEIIVPNWFFHKRKNQLHFINYLNLCFEEKLINSINITDTKNPFISVILPHYNRAKMLLKSVRSIQNQSLKNIEIIIVNDCSTDNSSIIFDYLLNTDPRIRIFHHVRNMGLFRTRVDGFLYSRGKYLISLEPDDFYEDNYVLEDSYNILEKYNLDSVKFLLRTITNYKNIKHFQIMHRIYKTKIVFGDENIRNYHYQIFGNFWTIWNRLVKSDIYMKGLYLVENYVLNLYKNMWDDIWQNTIINKVSNNFTIIRRFGYIYYVSGKGEGSIKSSNDKQRDNLLREFLEFLYFDYNMSPKKDNKTNIINQLKIYYEENNNIKLSFLKTKFYILYDLIHMLINDPYVARSDKQLLKKILEQTRVREKSLKKNNTW